MIMEVIYNLIQEKSNACVHQSSNYYIAVIYKIEGHSDLCGGLDIVTDVFS